MKTYVRGNCLSPEVQATLTAAGLKKYWLVDADDKPIGKPFLRRFEVELYEATQGGDYEIVANPRGKPRQYATEQERKAAHDRKRSTDPARRQYKAEWIRRKRQTDKI